MPSSGGSKRVRVGRAIYRQTNGRYAVCVMVEGRPRFRTIDAGSLSGARRQRELLQSAARVGELPVSPRLTFAEVSVRWLAEFEAKVTAGGRRGRTLDLFPSHLRRDPLPPRRPPRPAPLTPPEFRAGMREVAVEGGVAPAIK